MSIRSFILAAARLLLVLLLLALLVVPVAAGIMTLPAIAIQTIAVLLVFGLWSASCVVMGAWLWHRSRFRESPVPDLADAQSIFDYIRGKSDKDDAPDSPQDLAGQIPFRL